jgi:hypothetical protein
MDHGSQLVVGAIRISNWVEHMQCTPDNQPSSVTPQDIVAPDHRVLFCPIPVDRLVLLSPLQPVDFTSVGGQTNSPPSVIHFAPHSYAEELDGMAPRERVETGRWVPLGSRDLSSASVITVSEQAQQVDVTCTACCRGSAKSGTAWLAKQSTSRWGSNSSKIFKVLDNVEYRRRCTDTR